MWIEREISGHIEQISRKRPCLLLTGARQVGKSSLLEKLFPNYRYISLDLPNVAREARENGSYFLEKHSEPLIIDEVQYAPELFRFLKIEIDKARERFGRYILTGSQKFSLMKGVGESLSGRISFFECHSLSIKELRAHENVPVSTAQILKWMIKGGYPEIHAQQLSPTRFYSDYLATYLERDVRQLINVKDLSTFNLFMKLLALRSGQVLSLHSLSKQVGVSSKTLKNWLSVLEASNIIYLLRPFYNNYNKRLLKSPKLYFLDTGLLCFLAGIHNEKSLEESSLLGAFFETLVLGEMVKNFCNQGLPVELYYFRENHNTEVDFIVPEGDSLRIYECKWKLQNGEIPKNIKKFHKIVGEGTVKETKIITASDGMEQIGKNCFVAGLVDL